MIQEFSGMHKNIGPQYGKDSPNTARMRLHQSWYRAEILDLPWGTGPSPKDMRELGSMLTRESGMKGYNFLTPQIFELAQRRIENECGLVETYRLLHNMLSSQPMCFNLFGPLALNHYLATQVFKSILQNQVKVVVDVKFEFAPKPASEYLGDRTAFDVFVEFIRLDGGLGFVGIETKLTEPFSRKYYDGPFYRRWMETPSSPWSKEAWNDVSNIQHNQLWRDHLLAEAMKRRAQSPYSCGFFMLIRHPLDARCAETVDKYRKLLRPVDNAFLDYPVDRLVNIMELVLEDAPQRRWLAAFKERYLNLSLSEEAWQER